MAKIEISSKRITLPSTEQQALVQALQELPRIRHRLTYLDVAEVAQPFFQRCRILEIDSPMPIPPMNAHVGRGPDGRFRLLTAHLPALNALAAQEQPAGLDDPDFARAYALLADEWTREVPWPEMLVKSFADIAWRSALSFRDKAAIKALDAAVGKEIQPMRLTQEEDGWVLTRWLQSDCRLVLRTLRVSRSGQVQRHDDVRAVDLAVHPGMIWGLVNGRFVPTG